MSRKQPKSTYLRLQFLVALFLVSGGILVGLWVAVSAAYENIRFVRGTNQLLSVVSVARNIALDRGLNDAAATSALYERLGLSTRDASQQTSLSLINPWDLPLTQEMSAAARVVRIQNTISSATCRRMIFFFAQDTRTLGVLAASVFDPVQSSVWRQLFDVRALHKVEQLDLSAVKAACGQADRVVLSLTFSLN